MQKLEVEDLEKKHNYEVFIDEPLLERVEIKRKTLSCKEKIIKFFGVDESNTTFNLGYKGRWANRTLFTDWFVCWISPYIRHCYEQE